MVEIYMDTLIDLLCVKEQKKLEIKEDIGGNYIQGVTVLLLISIIFFLLISIIFFF